jgi:hypothetical protein
MPVRTTVRGADGRFAPYTVGNSLGCLMNQCGVSITEFIGDAACSNIMELVSFQQPVMRTIHSRVNQWRFYQRELQINVMLHSMTFSVPQCVVRQDIDSVFNMWEATGFNLDMRWDHANIRWVSL